eukprot:8123302-Pyramimonas_sp.AAC.1
MAAHKGAQREAQEEERLTGAQQPQLLPYLQPKRRLASKDGILPSIDTIAISSTIRASVTRS